MKYLLCTFVLLFSGLQQILAQAPIPARPVDPSQGLPAQPVLPTPAPLAPATSTNSPSTNAPGTTAPQTALAIIADSSLKQVLQELAQSWADSLDSNPQVPLTLTNAGNLRAKVEAGSTWDVVISADVQDVKEMTDKGALMPGGQQSLARNTLVIYGRKALVKDDELDWYDLVGSEWKKVALGNPDLVASGRVAKRALQKHDLMGNDTKGLYVYGGTESQVLGFAEREEADAVLVYRTDVVGINLPGFETIPIKAEDSPPVFYTAAVSRLAKNPDLARAFIDFCGSEPAKEIWKKHGFETN